MPPIITRIPAMRTIQLSIDLIKVGIAKKLNEKLIRYNPKSRYNKKTMKLNAFTIF